MPKALARCSPNRQVAPLPPKAKRKHLTKALGNSSQLDRPLTPKAFAVQAGWTKPTPEGEAQIDERLANSSRLDRAKAEGEAQTLARCWLIQVGWT